MQILIEFIINTIVSWLVTRATSFQTKKCTFPCTRPISEAIERLRNENDDKTKTQMTQSLNQDYENETKIWRQNIHGVPFVIK